MRIIPETGRRCIPYRWLRLFNSIIGKLSNERHLTMHEWSLCVSDPCADFIAGEVDSLGFTVLNDPNIATRPSSNSSPDVVFVQTPLALNLIGASRRRLTRTSFLFLSASPMTLRRFATEEPFSASRKKSGTTSSENRRRCSPVFRLRLHAHCARGEKEWRRVLHTILGEELLPL